jgi:hypothetical protein
VLLAGKFWEGDDGCFRRRFVTLLAGLVIGWVAFGAGQLFLVDLPDLDQWTAHPAKCPALNLMYAADGTPLLAAYLFYFAGLFVILRWWTQTDPLRKVRLSIWATATCLLWAWIMHTFCQFPQPWGFAVAAAISVAVQLAAPWVNWNERAAIGQLAREV